MFAGLLFQLDQLWINEVSLCEDRNQQPMKKYQMDDDHLIECTFASNWLKNKSDFCMKGNMRFPKKHVKDTCTGKSFSITVCLIRYTRPCIELFIYKGLGMSRFPDSAPQLLWPLDQRPTIGQDQRSAESSQNLGVQRPFRWDNNVWKPVEHSCGTLRPNWEGMSRTFSPISG